MGQWPGHDRVLWWRGNTGSARILGGPSSLFLSSVPPPKFSTAINSDWELIRCLFIRPFLGLFAADVAGKEGCMAFNESRGTSRRSSDGDFFLPRFRLRERPCLPNNHFLLLRAVSAQIPSDSLFYPCIIFDQIWGSNIGRMITDYSQPNSF